MTEFILFGASVWFWIIFGLFVIALLCAERYESGTTATVSLVIFIALLKFWGNLSELLHRYVSWQMIVGYVIVGFLYCIFRFYLLGRKYGAKHAEAIQKFAQKKSYDLPLNDDQLKEFEGSSYDNTELSTSEKRDKVIRWWLNWPASLFWWVLSDFFQNIGSFLWHFFGSIFQKAFNSGKVATSKVAATSNK